MEQSDNQTPYMFLSSIGFTTQLPPTKVGGLRLRPPPTKSGQTVADSAKTIFTERMMKLIVFKTLNAPAKAGGFYQLMENKISHSET